MKTLKFMLAAATAIGLASATQADQFNTTGFEKLGVGTSVTTGVEDNREGYSYFYYAGSVAEDNESVIAEGTPNIARPRGAAAVDAERQKILQVSTGTDPLMRTYAPIAGGAPQAATTLAADTYVDTLVQFTVTPYTDTVTPSNGVDKLMIYLKESVVTNEFGEITSASTNLVVVGGYFTGNTSAREYVLNTGAVTVQPNTWHRLTVKAVVDLSGDSGAGFPAFQIWVDGVLCRLANGATTYDTTNTEAADLFSGFDLAEDIDAGKYVLSLLAGTGEVVAKLQGVGFAGEGKVDDIVFSDLNPFATVFDFTFTPWDSEKVDAVSYTVGVGSEATTLAGTYEVEENSKIKINSITYAAGWQEGTIDAVGLSGPDQDGWYTVTNTASLTISPVQASGWVDDYTTVTNQTVAQAYPSLASTALATANAGELTVWAKANSVDFSTAAATIAAAETLYTEAFLLNCAPTAAAVEDEKEDFVLDISVAADGTITVSLPSGKDYNGTLQMKGSNDLSAWTNVSEATSSYKFYKYELSLPAASL